MGGKVPHLIYRTNQSRLWFLQDDEYLLPKSFFAFELENPVAYLSPLNSAALSLFARLFKDDFTDVAYDAEMIGLK